MKEGWTYKKLGEVVTFDKRFKGVDRAVQKQVVSFPHVSAEELKLMVREVGDVKLLATGLFEGYTSEEIAGDNLCEGEVITIPTGGNANIKYYKGKFVDSGNILAIAKDGNTYLKFVWYYLLYKNAFLESCYKGTSIKHPFMPDIWELLVPIIDISEQRSIVIRLDAAFAKIDALKANAERQLVEARQLFQAELAECMRPKEGWEEKTIDDVAYFRNGIAHEKEIDKEGEYIVINSKFVSSEGGVRKYTNEQLSPLYKDDIVMVMSDVPKGKTLAKCYIVECDNKYSLNQRICSFKTKGPIVRFLYYMINRNPFLLAYDNGENQTNLRKKQILECPVAYPKDNLIQQHVVSHLDALSANVRRLEEVQRKTLAECDALKQAMLREVFE